MVDIANEKLFALADIPQRLPKRRGGKRINLATLYRWAQRGVKGVRLEVVQVGGTKCTSLAALQRFFDRLAAGADCESSAIRTDKHRKRASEKAGAELKKAGW